MGPGAPAREPQIAANASMVVLTFGAGKAIYFSSSRDGGNTFSAPAKVAEAGIVPLSRHRGPRIALAGNTIVITAVAGNKPEEGAHAHGLPSDGDLLVWRSPGRREDLVPRKGDQRCPRFRHRRPARARFRRKGNALRRLARQARRQRHQALLLPLHRWRRSRGRRISPVYRIARWLHLRMLPSVGGYRRRRQASGDVAQRAGRLARYVPGDFARRRDLFDPAETRQWHVASERLPDGRRRPGRIVRENPYRLAAREQCLPRRAGPTGKAGGHGQGCGAGAERQPDLCGLGERLQVEAWIDGKVERFPAPARSPRSPACRAAACSPPGKKTAPFRFAGYRRACNTSPNVAIPGSLLFSRSGGEGGFEPPVQFFTVRRFSKPWMTSLG